MRKHKRKPEQHVQLMKLLVFISILTPFFLSCKTQKDTLYGKCQKHYFVCTQTLLKANGEFEYFQFYDVGGATIVKGRWENRKDTIVLNTYEQEENRIDTVIESTTDNKKSIVKFEGSFWGYVEVDSSRLKVDTGQEVIEFNAPLKNITFYFLGDQGNLIPVQYNVKNPSANQFEVKVRGLTTGLIFRNEKFIKTKNGLKYIDKPWIKKKTAFKNKQW